MKDDHIQPDAPFSILDLHEPGNGMKLTPAWFQDLNLDTILNQLTKKWGYPLRKLFLYLPETSEDEAYRRAVYGDVKKRMSAAH